MSTNGKNEGSILLVYMQERVTPNHLNKLADALSKIGFSPNSDSRNNSFSIKCSSLDGAGINFSRDIGNETIKVDDLEVLSYLVLRISGPKQVIDKLAEKKDEIRDFVLGKPNTLDLSSLKAVCGNHLTLGKKPRTRLRVKSTQRRTRATA